jgi:NAD(P)H-dependent flavin oxidoreductase YrpB (nitropropane dioxygenase family)
MSSLFNSKFPILSAPMNKVSDANLAIAVHAAGAFPSISAFNFQINGSINYQQLKEELTLVKKSTNSNNLLLSIGDHLDVNEILSLYNDGLISHLELICESVKVKGTELDDNQIEFFRRLRDKLLPLKLQGMVIILKALNIFPIRTIYKYFKNSLFDGFVIKGPAGAGIVIDVNATRSLENDIIRLLSEYPDLKLIASGGISSAEEIKKYIDLGVDSIAIGTALAMSRESCVSIETKNEILKRKDQPLEKFVNLNQRAMIFSTINDDDQNHTKSLVKGIESPSEGHIYVGTGISKILEIKSVKEIIETLSQKL